MKPEEWESAVGKLSLADRAALRRAAGLLPIKADAYAAALRCFGKALTEQQYAAICLECLWRSTDHPRVMPMESCISRIANRKDASASIRKRAESLLDMIWSEDGFLLGKIANLVRIIRSDSDSIRPDFYLLSEDLRKWNYESRSVQRKWLNAVYLEKVEKGEDKNVD